MANASECSRALRRSSATLDVRSGDAIIGSDVRADVDDVTDGTVLIGGWASDVCGGGGGGG